MNSVFTSKADGVVKDKGSVSLLWLFPKMSFWEGHGQEGAGGGSSQDQPRSLCLGSLAQHRVRSRVARDGNTLIQVSRMGTVVVSQPDADSPVLGDQKQSHAVCVQLPSLRLFWLSPKPGHGFPMGVISCLAEQLLPLGAPSLRPGCQWKWGLAAIITINLAAFLPLSAATEATVDGCAVQGQVPNLKSCFFAFSQGWFYQHL